MGLLWIPNDDIGIRSLGNHTFARIETEDFSGIGAGNLHKARDIEMAAIDAVVIHDGHAILDARRFFRPAPPRIDVADLRAATWAEETISFAYVDAKGAPTRREVDPLGIVYLQDTNMLMAWCHLRRDYRVFRLDRMDDLRRTGQSFRPRRVPMLREYTARLRAEAEARATACGDD